MVKTKLQINGTAFEVLDYRGAIEDYRNLSSAKLLKDGQSLVPLVDEKFFASQGYSLPAVKIDDETYLFPTNAKAIDKNSSIKDYSNICVTSLDLLVASQKYYYNLAKVAYEKKPRLRLRHRLVHGEIISGMRKIPFRKSYSNSMSYVQYNLSTLIHGENKRWDWHRELQEEIRFKENDIKFQIDEQENAFTKGEYTSYGDKNLMNTLYEKYGIKVKLQNGGLINASQIRVIEKAFMIFFETFGSIKKISEDFGLRISYSGDKHMHGRRASGLFSSYFRIVGISNRGNIGQTLSHELGHFIDFYIGAKNGRHYLSDDKSSIAGQIAIEFRKNMALKQHSDYQNRTEECFARAVEQYFSIANNIEIDNRLGSYCLPQVFCEKLNPMFVKLIHQLGSL